MRFGKFFRSRLLCLARCGNSTETQETDWAGFGWPTCLEITGLVNLKINQLLILVDITVLPQVYARDQALFGIGMLLTI